jgi:ABC-type glycerol-3-phosphate transport system substrate-binding protein
MRKMILILALLGSVGTLAGCGGSDAPKKDAEGKDLKPPDVPKDGP